MEAAGYVERVGARGSSALYARCGTRSHHHHIVCDGCGRVAHAECPVAVDMPSKRADGFVVTRHEVTLYGLCPTCADSGMEPDVSHIHIPDGVLPLWLVIAGWIGAGALVALAVRRASAEETRRRVPLVGAMAALMLVGMSSEIIPIAYHINLTVLAGILLGPWLSIITALVVDVMLALIGHGGVTVVGLNTLVISAEMIAGLGAVPRLVLGVSAAAEWAWRQVLRRSSRWRCPPRCSWSSSRWGEAPRPAENRARSTRRR